MVACLYFGVKPEPVNPSPAPTFWISVRRLRLRAHLCCSDQGNRSTGSTRPGHRLLAAGVFLLIMFFLHEWRCPFPAVDLSVVLEPPCRECCARVVFAPDHSLHALVIPQFLQTVRGFRALEVGDTLAWIATPHY